MTNNYLDMEKPDKPGEILCAACWAVTKDKRGWRFFNFQYLKPVNLCPQCAATHVKDLTEKQNAGL